MLDHLAVSTAIHLGCKRMQQGVLAPWPCKSNTRHASSRFELTRCAQPSDRNMRPPTPIHVGWPPPSFTQNCLAACPGNTTTNLLAAESLRHRSRRARSAANAQTLRSWQAQLNTLADFYAETLKQPGGVELHDAYAMMGRRHARRLEKRALAGGGNALYLLPARPPR